MLCKTEVLLTELKLMKESLDWKFVILREKILTSPLSYEFQSHLNIVLFVCLFVLFLFS